MKVDIIFVVCTSTKMKQSTEKKHEGTKQCVVIFVKKSFPDYFQLCFQVGGPSQINVIPFGLATVVML